MYFSPFSVSLQNDFFFLTKAIRKIKSVLKCIKMRLVNLLQAVVLESVESSEFILLLY